MIEFDEYKVKLNNLKPALEELGEALKLDDARRELEELRSRPVDVAVQEPDPAGIEKRAAELAKDAQVKAEQDAAAAIAKAKQEAKDKLKKAEERAKAERAELERVESMGDMEERIHTALCRLGLDFDAVQKFALGLRYPRTGNS